MITNAQIDTMVEQVKPELIALRRKLHENPELAFEEHQTAALIADYLGRLGISPRTGIGKTGVTGLLKGAGNHARRVGVRADMDALPIEEQSGVSFASRVSGKMHACGHDMHVAIALGVARVLHELRDALPGDVQFIFQPAEETLAGAAAMISEGVLEDAPLDFVIGYHNWPPVEAGAIGYHPSAVMASSEDFEIVLKGRTGHAAHPHTAVDAIVGAAELVMQIQTIVSREIAPSIPTVVSIWHVQAGSTRSVIADRAILKGTARSLDSSVAREVEAAVRRITEGVARSLRLEHEVTWVKRVPVLRNDPRVLARVLASARDILGPRKVVDVGQASLGSEDFAWFAERVPAAHLRIGSRIEGLETAIHRNNYNCNESALPTGVRVVARAVVDLLTHGIEKD